MSSTDRRRELLLLLGAICIATAVVAVRPASVAAAVTSSGPAAVEALDDRPNIILFMTDDQNRNEMRWLPKTTSLLGENGVTFNRALSPAPLCCPARAMTVTGQYGQNNGVQHNSGPFGAYHALLDPDNNLGAWLQAAGYQTALVGKYLNGYQGDNTPPVAGWTRWNPSVVGIYTYINTTFLDGTGTRTYTRNVTPVIADYTEKDVRAFSATGLPFFIWVSQLAPHGASTDADNNTWGPPIPTVRHQDDLGNVRVPSRRKPSFNVAGAAPVPYPGKAPRDPRAIQRRFTGRIRTLQDVDDAVERLVAVLRDTDELDDTYILFVSDNALMLGEHRLVRKNVLYREDLAIPLVVRVPGSAARTSRTPVTIVDLAPTILDLAGAVPGRTLDGQSFAPVLRGQPVVWRDTQLIQTGSVRTEGPQPGWDFRGVRTARYTYMVREADGAQFLYDRSTDPYELRNLAGSGSYAAVIAELRRRLDLLETCSGLTCSQQFGPLPDPA